MPITPEMIQEFKRRGLPLPTIDEVVAAEQGRNQPAASAAAPGADSSWNLLDAAERGFKGSSAGLGLQKAGVLGAAPPEEAAPSFPEKVVGGIGQLAGSPLALVGSMYGPVGTAAGFAAEDALRTGLEGKSAGEIGKAAIRGGAAGLGFGVAGKLMPAVLPAATSMLGRIATGGAAMTGEAVGGAAAGQTAGELLEHGIPGEGEYGAAAGRIGAGMAEEVPTNIGLMGALRVAKQVSRVGELRKRLLSTQQGNVDPQQAAAVVQSGASTQPQPPGTGQGAPPPTPAGPGGAPAGAAATPRDGSQKVTVRFLKGQLKGKYQKWTLDQAERFQQSFPDDMVIMPSEPAGAAGTATPGAGSGQPAGGAPTGPQPISMRNKPGATAQPTAPTAATGTPVPAASTWAASQDVPVLMPGEPGKRQLVRVSPEGLEAFLKAVPGSEMVTETQAATATAAGGSMPVTPATDATKPVTQPGVVIGEPPPELVDQATELAQQGAFSLDEHMADDIAAQFKVDPAMAQRVADLVNQRLDTEGVEEEGPADDAIPLPTNVPSAGEVTPADQQKMAARTEPVSGDIAKVATVDGDLVDVPVGELGKYLAANPGARRITNPSEAAVILNAQRQGAVGPPPAAGPPTPDFPTGGRMSQAQGALRRGQRMAGEVPPAAAPPAVEPPVQTAAEMTEIPATVRFQLENLGLTKAMIDVLSPAEAQEVLAMSTIEAPEPTDVAPQTPAVVPSTGKSAEELARTAIDPNRSQAEIQAALDEMVNRGSQGGPPLPDLEAGLKADRDAWLNRVSAIDVTPKPEEGVPPPPPTAKEIVGKVKRARKPRKKKDVTLGMNLGPELQALYERLFGKQEAETAAGAEGGEPIYRTGRRDEPLGTNLAPQVRKAYEEILARRQAGEPEAPPEEQFTPEDQAVAAADTTPRQPPDFTFIEGRVARAEEAAQAAKTKGLPEDVYAEIAENIEGARGAVNELRDYGDSMDPETYRSRLETLQEMLTVAQDLPRLGPEMQQLLMAQSGGAFFARDPSTGSIPQLARFVERHPRFAIFHGITGDVIYKKHMFQAANRDMTTEVLKGIDRKGQLPNVADEMLRLPGGERPEAPEQPAMAEEEAAAPGRESRVVEVGTRARNKEKGLGKRAQRGAGEEVVPRPFQGRNPYDVLKSLKGLTIEYVSKQGVRATGRVAQRLSADRKLQIDHHRVNQNGARIYTKIEPGQILSTEGVPDVNPVTEINPKTEPEKLRSFDRTSAQEKIPFDFGNKTVDRGPQGEIMGPREATEAISPEHGPLPVRDTSAARAAALADTPRRVAGSAGLPEQLRGVPETAQRDVEFRPGDTVQVRQTPGEPRRNWTVKRQTPYGELELEDPRGIGKDRTVSLSAVSKLARAETGEVFEFGPGKVPESKLGSLARITRGLARPESDQPGAGPETADVVQGESAITTPGRPAGTGAPAKGGSQPGGPPPSGSSFDWKRWPKVADAVRKALADRFPMGSRIEWGDPGVSRVDPDTGKKIQKSGTLEQGTVIGYRQAPDKGGGIIVRLDSGKEMGVSRAARPRPAGEREAPVQPTEITGLGGKSTVERQQSRLSPEELASKKREQERLARETPRDARSQQRPHPGVLGPEAQPLSFTDARVAAQALRGWWVEGRLPGGQAFHGRVTGRTTGSLIELWYPKDPKDLAVAGGERPRWVTPEQLKYKLPQSRTARPISDEEAGSEGEPLEGQPTVGGVRAGRGEPPELPEEAMEGLLKEPPGPPKGRR